VALPSAATRFTAPTTTFFNSHRAPARQQREAQPRGGSFTQPVATHPEGRDIAGAVKLCTYKRLAAEVKPNHRAIRWPIFPYGQCDMAGPSEAVAPTT